MSFLNHKGYFVPDILHSSRLYTETDLGAGRTIAASPEQSHYLQNVMRLKADDELRLFNGRDGEWRGALKPAGRKQPLQIEIHEQLKQQVKDADLWLCCAPIKKAHFEFMVEKATELGAAVIQPVLTARTQIREVNTMRCRTIAIEAAEQSERLSVPEIRTPLALDKLAAAWPEKRLPIVCAEWGKAQPVAEVFASMQPDGYAGIAILTGPEGGFTAEELALMKRLPCAVPVRLGPRILRADTAALAALSCWQALRGDWLKE